MVDKRGGIERKNLQLDQISLHDTMISKKIEALRGNKGSPPSSSSLRRRALWIWSGAAVIAVLGIVWIIQLLNAEASEPLENHDLVALRSQINGLHNTVETLSATIKGYEKRVQSLEELQERSRKATPAVATPNAAKTSGDPLEHELLKRITALEDQVSLISAVSREDLEKLRQFLEEELDKAQEAGLAVSRRAEELRALLQEQKQRLGEMEGSVDTLEQDSPSGFFAEIDRFLDYAEEGFASIQTRRRVGKREKWGDGYEVTELFYKSLSTTIWVARGTRWCEVVLSEKSIQASGIDAFESMYLKIHRTAPSGWSIQRSFEMSALAAAVVQAPDGSHFSMVLSQPQKNRSRYVLSFQFGRS